MEVSRLGYHEHQISGVKWQSGTWKNLKEILLLINFVSLIIVHYSYRSSLAAPDTCRKIICFITLGVPVVQEGRRNTIFFMYMIETSAFFWNFRENVNVLKNSLLKMSNSTYNRLSGQQMLSGNQIISTSHGMTGRNFFDVFLPFYLLFGFYIYVWFVVLQMRNLHTKYDSIGFNI
jgi:superfamily I DNA/RNA helicase